MIEIDPGDWVYLESNTGKSLTWKISVQGAANVLATDATSYAITAAEQGQTLELVVAADDSGAGGPATATATISVPAAASAEWAAPSVTASDGGATLTSGGNTPAAPTVTAGDASAELTGAQAWPTM